MKSMYTHRQIYSICLTIYRYEVNPCMFIDNIIVQGYILTITATDPPNHRRSNPLGSEKKNLTPKTPIYVRNAAN